VAFAYFIYELITSIAGKKSREQDIDNSHDKMMASMLPRTKKEKWLFSFRTLSAAICEEILFRGFLLFLLQSVFPDMPIYLIVVIACVIFGIAHIYQGLQAVISIGLLSVLFMCLYLVTDSLILAMLLHFATDFSATFILSEEQPV
jgi:membrane protease YdiL (CAAX protease family)